MPPCVSSPNHVHLVRPDPCNAAAVTIGVKVRRKDFLSASTAEERQDDAEYLRSVSLTVTPHWVPPLLEKEVADAEKPSEAEVFLDTPLDDWAFGTEGKSNASCNPFWAVRRIAPNALRLENEALVAKGKKVKYINCVEARQNMFNVFVGVVSQQSVNSTRILEIPFMTNAVDVEKGD